MKKYYKWITKEIFNTYVSIFKHFILKVEGGIYNVPTKHLVKGLNKEQFYIISEMRALEMERFIDIFLQYQPIKDKFNLMNFILLIYVNDFAFPFYSCWSILTISYER